MEPISASATNHTPSTSVVEVTHANFMQDVIQASMQQPVLVYFWAPWCSACKTYGPMLEKQVNAAQGAVRLAKVNIDSNTQIAAQFRVQSVPTTYIFLRGQPVDGFAGALKEPDIAQLLKQFAGHIPPAEPPIEEWLSQAEALAAQGNAEDALKMYEALYAQAPENAKLVAGYGRLLLEGGDLEGAKSLLAALPETAKDVSLDAVRAMLKLAESGSGADIAALQKAVMQNPSDHESRYQLAAALFACARQEEAIDALLDIVRTEPEWSERKARTQLLTFFEALGFAHPLSMQGRRKLSSLLFS